uniref:Short-chain dehydrogenase/reductase SDR n=1 Tax=Rhabditophanes sp. KR3021 TaxID=114890 RepID=A0AC35TKX3_9BILA
MTYGKGQKFALITGANQGIGYETAKKFAMEGFNVKVACRNEVEGVKTVDKLNLILKRNGLGNSVSFVHLDLVSLASVEACANELLESGVIYDLIVLNAGVLFPKDKLTEDGFETTFQVNFLGHYLLVRKLVNHISYEYADVKVINMTSIMYSMTSRFWSFPFPSNAGEWNDLVRKDGPSKEEREARHILTKRMVRFQPYAVSKAAITMNAFQLNELPNVTSIAVHPGCVKTTLSMNTSNSFQIIVKIMKAFFTTPQKAALNVFKGYQLMQSPQFNPSKYLSAKQTQTLRKFVLSTPNFIALQSFIAETIPNNHRLPSHL